MRARLLVVSALVVLAVRVPAGGPQGPILLDVVVQDARGQSVQTLGTADFTARDANGALTIDSVRFVRAGDAAAAEGPRLAPSRETDEDGITPTSRLFAIFLDEYHVTPGPEAERARDALTRFVRDELGPADLLVVLRPFDSLLQIRLVRERATAIAAIEAFEPRRGDFRPRTSTEQSLMAGAPARAAAMRAQVSASALEALVTHLGRFDAGRKTLIVASEGFVRSSRRGDADPMPTLESVAAAANSARVAVYAVDPRLEAGNAAADASSTIESAEARARESLKWLAEGTSGRVIGADDPTAGLRAALADASGYYLLALTRTGERPDGRFHRVQVEVRRPQLTARARSGYWQALSEAAPVVPASTVSGFASRIVRRTSPLIQPWFGMSRNPDGATRIRFVWEPTARVPGDRTASRRPARVALTVTTLDGTAVFEGVVLPTDGVPAASGAEEASFVQPAGRLLVQMAIEDESERVIDRDVRDLVVGAFAGPVALGSAEVLPARNAREFHAITIDRTAPPVARRQFSRADRLLVRVPVSSAGATPTLVARLLNAAGGTMRDLPVVAPDRAGQPFLVDVPLAGLAPGAYAVEFVARTADVEARDRLPLRVTP